MRCVPWGDPDTCGGQELDRAAADWRASEPAARGQVLYLVSPLLRPDKYYRLQCEFLPNPHPLLFVSPESLIMVMTYRIYLGASVFALSISLLLTRDDYLRYLIITGPLWYAYFFCAFICGYTLGMRLIESVRQRSRGKMLRHSTYIIMRLLVALVVHSLIRFVYLCPLEVQKPHFRTNILTGQCNFGGAAPCLQGDPWYYVPGCTDPSRATM